jgi:hypothetical protein
MRTKTEEVTPRHPALRTRRQSAQASCCRSGGSWKGPAHLHFTRTTRILVGPVQSLQIYLAKMEAF